jgi:hypothetical protein
MVELELEPELQARVERLAAQTKVSASLWSTRLWSIL